MKTVLLQKSYIFNTLLVALHCLTHAIDCMASTTDIYRIWEVQVQGVVDSVPGESPLSWLAEGCLPTVFSQQ